MKELYYVMWLTNAGVLLSNNYQAYDNEDEALQEAIRRDASMKDEPTGRRHAWVSEKNTGKIIYIVENGKIHNLRK